jgi:WD40 repeat protein
VSFADAPIDPTKTRLGVELKHNSPFLGCRFDPSGRFVFAGGQENAIQRWELSNQRKTTLTGHRSWVRSFAFHAESKKMLSADYVGKVLVWPTEAEQPQSERAIDAHEGWVRAIAMAPDGRTFATCGNDRLVKIWSFPECRLVWTLEGHGSHVYNVAFHPGGRFLVSAELRGAVKQWDLNDGKPTREFDASALFRHDNTFRADHGGIRSLAFNADGSVLAGAGITNVTNAFAGVGNPAVLLFNWQTGQRQQILRPQAAFQGTGWGVAFHPDNFVLGVGGGNGGVLWFWRPDREQSAHALTLPNNARDLHLHPASRKAAIAFFDNAVRIYELS